MPQLLILSLGSNLGDRVSVLREAIDDLSEEVGNLLGISPVYETEPIAEGNHPPYLNLTVAFSSILDPEAVLAITQKIEQNFGRTSKGDLAPRVLDIDLISIGSYRTQNERLVLPHPRMNLRKFVLLPLSDLCPDWKNPATGDQLSKLVSACVDSSWIIRNSYITI